MAEQTNPVETVTKQGKVETVLGETLATPVTFDYSFKQYRDAEAMRAAGEWPKDSDVVDYRNAELERNALSQARQKAVSEDVKRIQGTVEYRRKQWIEDTVKRMPGIDRAVVEGMAAQYIKDEPQS